MGFPLAKSRALRRTASISRTFPGQLWAISDFRARSDKSEGREIEFLRDLFHEMPGEQGMSSFRFLSDGRLMVRPVDPEEKILAEFPSATRRSRSRCSR
jgi:hypothetical protein